MTRQEFLSKLRIGLDGLSKKEVEERINFYSEMLDDKIEEGFLEEDAVSSLGSIDNIVAQIKREVSVNNAKKVDKKSYKPWQVTLIALGSPIWLSILIALFAVIVSLYVVVWALVVTLWSIFVSFCAGAVAGALGIFYAFIGNPYTGIILFGTGLVLAGLAVFMYFACKYFTKLSLLLTKKGVKVIANCFSKKGA